MIKRALVAAIVSALVASGAMAVGLTDIAPLSGQTTSLARGVTSDGIVVGASGTQGFIWDAANGARSILSSDGAGAENAYGVGYRTVNGQQQLVITGRSAGYFTQWFSNDAGVSFGPKFRDQSYAPVIPECNGTAGTATDLAWSIVGVNNLNQRLAQSSGANGAYPMANVAQQNASVPYKSSIQGISGTGVGVGRVKDAIGFYQNTTFTWNNTGSDPAVAYFAGLDGSNYGEAWAISNDGTSIAGVSSVLDRAGSWGYKRIGGTTYELPYLPGTTGSTVLVQPYGISQTGDWVAGKDYVGAERAALWYTPGTDTANWSVIDLTTYFQNRGQLGWFSKLTRAYSVAEDGNGGVWVSGWGTNTAGTQRAFVAYIPEPATASLLLLGGLAMLRRRR